MNNIKRFVLPILCVLMVLSTFASSVSAKKQITEKDIVWVKYEEVASIGEGLLKVSLNGLYGVIDMKGKVVLPPKYTQIYPFKDGLAPVMKEDIIYQYRYGFIDKTGKEVIPVKYYNEPEFYNGVATARVEDQWFLINKKGVEKKLDYDNVYPFKEGLARVCNGKYPNTKYGFIDTDGNEVIPLDYNYADDFSEGLAAIHMGEKYDLSYILGYIDKTGKTVIPCQFTDARPFEYGVAEVCNEQKYGNEKYYIDKKGKELFAGKYDRYWPITNKLMIVVKGKYTDAKYGVIDMNGKEIIPLKYDFIRLNEGEKVHIYVQKYGPNRSSEETATGLFDLSGKVVIQPAYYSISPMRDGLIKVRKTDPYRNYFGFADATGKVVIPLKYDIADDFKDGLAVVGKGQYSNVTYGVINKKGKEVVPIKYRDAGYLNNGYFVVGTGSDYYNRKYGIIDKTGKVVIPIKYRFITELDENHVLIPKQNNGSTIFGILKTSP